MYQCILIECILSHIGCCVLTVSVLVGSADTQIEKLKLQGNETVMLEDYSIVTLVFEIEKKPCRRLRCSDFITLGWGILSSVMFN